MGVKWKLGTRFRWVLRRQVMRYDFEREHGEIFSGLLFGLTLLLLRFYPC